MTDPATGATPAAGATPTDAGNPPEAPKPPATPTAPAAPATSPAPTAPAAPATGDEGLGDAGLRALNAERDARKTAEKELAALKAAGQTEQEKATAEAVKAAKAEERASGDSRIRRSEVRSALRVKGLTNEKALDLAVTAPAFAALKVEEDGSILDLTKVIDQFAKDYPEMFSAATGAGDVNRGPNDGSPAGQPTTLEGALAAHYGSPRR